MLLALYICPSGIPAAFPFRLRSSASISRNRGCMPFSPVPRFTDWNRQPIEHRSNLLEVETIDAGRVAIAERAR